MLAFNETYAHLLLESPSPGVVTVTLNRPESLNALNTQMGHDLVLCFRRLSQDIEVRAVVLRGAGERAFCAGADLKERDGMTDQQWLDQHRVFEDAFRSVLECRAPVIVVVEGHALGGGLELALNGDFIVASQTATFGQPEVMRGITPGGGGTQLLPRFIGRARAKELIFTARRFDAAEAEQLGLVARVVPKGKLDEEVEKTARAIVANAPISLRQAKRAVDRGLDVDLASGLRLEREAYNVTLTTEDRNEGLRAFAEKRRPRFQGR